MEMLSLSLGQPEEYQEALRQSLQQAGPVRIITIDEATVNKKPGAVITFKSMLPDGRIADVQAVVTVALLKATLGALKGRYPND